MTPTRFTPRERPNTATPAIPASADSRRRHSKPGVLLVGNFLSKSGGTEQVCETMAGVLRGRGWPVVTTSSRMNRPARWADMTGTAWLRRRDYAVAQVAVFSGPAFAWAETVCAVLRRLDKPYVLTLHGGSLPQFAAESPRRVRRLLRAASAVTVPSRFLQEEMAEYRPDLILIPNPLFVARYPMRRRDDPAPRLAWLRAFHTIYNPTLGPRVVSLLKGEFDDVTLTMIGPERDMVSLAETRRTALELGVADRVFYPGGVPKDDVPRHLEPHDVFLNTTNVDNTPVSVVEAMACGLCVVSTDVAGMPYLLEHEVDALLVPPDDAAAMAMAVTRILREPGLAGRLSRNARAKAESYDWSVVLPQWERLFAGLGGLGG